MGNIGLGKKEAIVCYCMENDIKIERIDAAFVRRVLVIEKYYDKESVKNFDANEKFVADVVTAVKDQQEKCAPRDHSYWW